MSLPLRGAAKELGREEGWPETEIRLGDPPQVFGDEPAMVEIVDSLSGDRIGRLGIRVGIDSEQTVKWRQGREGVGDRVIGPRMGVDWDLVTRCQQMARELTVPVKVVSGLVHETRVDEIDFHR